MVIESLQVTNFRNYASAQISFGSRTNIIYGDNAQGKTNLLEAVYLFSHGRSHRAKSDSETLRFGADYFRLNICFADSVRDYQAMIHYASNGKKQIKINNVPITKLSRLVNYLNVVMFSPGDLELVKGAPAVRRRFLDEAISQLYPGYLQSLIEYHRALAQKNSLLKALRLSGVHQDSQLSIWNQQLAESGAAVMEARQTFTAELAGFAADIHLQISGESLGLSYTPNIDGGANPLESFYQKLEQNQAREIDAGVSQYGVQRDDLGLTINGNDTKTYGSQGQQLTAVLSLKIAETEYIRQVRGEYPVLLLDDIMSELDLNRRLFLAEKIRDKQVLLTCTDSDIPVSTENTRLFYVKDGTVTQKEA